MKHHVPIIMALLGLLAVTCPTPAPAQTTATKTTATATPKPATTTPTAVNNPRDQHPDAPTELQRILDLDAAARKSGDSLARLKIALKLRAFLNDGSDGILSVAHAYSVLKDSDNVFKTLTQYAAMGLGNEAICNGEDKKFSWLAISPGFSNICRLIQKNNIPVSSASTIIQFPDTGYLAEDIDYDPTANTFLFTSILHHAIYRLSWDGNCRQFATSPGNWPIMAIKVDPAHNLVWATEVAMPGFGAIPDTAKGRSAVCCFDLRTGMLKQRLEAPEDAQWGDMVLDTQGNPIVCDGQSGAIFRFRQDNWQRLDKGDFISPQTPTLTRDGKQLIIPDYERGLALMTIATGEVTWIRNDPAHPCALNGIDGVYLQTPTQSQPTSQSRLFLTQNGVQPERVLQITLDKTNTHLTGRTLIERATPTLGEPTHGVLVAGKFYFIANSGWDALDRHGNLKPGARMTPPRLMRYSPPDRSSSKPPRP